VNEYEVLRPLGRGEFGEVVLGERRVAEEPPAEYALKKFNKQRLASRFLGFGRTRTALDKVYDEIDIMSSLYDRYCVLLFEVIDDPDANKLYLVTEYMPGGPVMTEDPQRPGGLLFQGKRIPLPEIAARRYCYGLLRGLRYLHSKRVAHRDIKPDNLLISPLNRCLIGDFGCAQVIPGATSAPARSVEVCDLPPVPGTQVYSGFVADSVGAPAFRSPEAVSGAPYDPFAADVWAAGVTLYCFLFGQLPFYSVSEFELVQSISNDPVNVAWPPKPFVAVPVHHSGCGDHCVSYDTEMASPTVPQPVEYGAPPSDLALDLVTKLLDKDTTTRLSLDDALKHPWILPEADVESPPRNHPTTFGSMVYRA
jgi:serine/threonine protein kinase